ncbi:MAG TPA: hypothetical protein VMC10_11965 [Stellaceae bacterium]|nr:hypothetical protein [Stellaceae bacterium]
MTMRNLRGLLIVAVIVAGLPGMAAARGFGGPAPSPGPGPQFFSGHPDSHFFSGRPNAHFFFGHPDGHFFFPGRRPIFLDRRRHIFVSPGVVTFDRFGHPLFPSWYWYWPYWADIPAAWLDGPAQIADATVTPEQPAPAVTRRDCRSFRTTLTIDGRPEPVHGKACQWLDGTWHVAP